MLPFVLWRLDGILWSFEEPHTYNSSTRKFHFHFILSQRVLLSQPISILNIKITQLSNDSFQMMSDAPAHHLFCLLGPTDPDTSVLPEVLCVSQVCLEGEISKQSIMQGLNRGKRASGDLIPWTMAQQWVANFIRGPREDRDWKLYFEKKKFFLNEWKFAKIPIKDPLQQLKCSVHAKFEVPTSNHCREFPTESL